MSSAVRDATNAQCLICIHRDSSGCAGRSAHYQQSPNGCARALDPEELIRCLERLALRRSWISWTSAYSIVSHICVRCLRISCRAPEKASYTVAHRAHIRSCPERCRCQRGRRRAKPRPQGAQVARSRAPLRMAPLSPMSTAYASRVSVGTQRRLGGQASSPKDAGTAPALRYFYGRIWLISSTILMHAASDSCCNSIQCICGCSGLHAARLPASCTRARIDPRVLYTRPLLEVVRRLRGGATNHRVPGVYSFRFCLPPWSMPGPGTPSSPSPRTIPSIHKRLIRMGPGISFGQSGNRLDDLVLN